MPLGLPVTEDQLADAAQRSCVLDIANDFLEPEFRAACEQIFPDPSEIEPADSADAFIFLKTKFQNLSM